MKSHQIFNVACSILLFSFAKVSAQSQSNIADELPICQFENEFLPELMHNTGSFGNMFEVRTKEYPVKVTEIAFSTDLYTNVTYHAWSKTGTYKNHETSEESWTKIAQGWTMGLGKEQPTPIPADSFEGMWIDPQQTQAFLIMLETPDIRYNYGSIEGVVLEEQDDFILMEGKSIAHFPPFREDTTFFSPRLFTGSVKYYVEKPCDEPSPTPSLIPSLAPSEHILVPTPNLSPEAKIESSFTSAVISTQAPTLTATLAPTSTPTLNSFETKVDFRYKFLVLYSEVVTVSTELKNITEFVLKDYFNTLGKDDSQKNQIMRKGNLNYGGVNSLSILGSEDFDCDIPDEGGQTCLVIENSVSVSHNHKVTQSEVTFAMLALKDLVYPLLSFTNKEYIGLEPLETVNTMRCYGVAYEAFDSEDTIEYLEQKVLEFLGTVQDQADITSVSLLDRNTVEVPEKSPFFRRMLQVFAARSRSHMMADVSSVDLTMAITGEYQPPPEIQFDELTKDSFDNEGDALVEMLQKGENEELRKITEIKPVEKARKDTIVEDIDIPPPPFEDEKSESTLIPIIASVVGICIIALFFFLVWGKQAKEDAVDGDSKMKQALKSESIGNMDQSSSYQFGSYMDDDIYKYSSRTELS